MRPVGLLNREEWQDDLPALDRIVDDHSMPTAQRPRFYAFSRDGRSDSRTGRSDVTPLEYWRHPAWGEELLYPTQIDQNVILLPGRITEKADRGELDQIGG